MFITTHSYDILSNEGIAPEEVLLLTNSPEGTEVEVLSNVEKQKIFWQPVSLWRMW